MVAHIASGEVAAFRYGLLATEVSRVLGRYARTGTIAKLSLSVLRKGRQLIQEILAAQDVVSGTSNLAPPGARFDMQAYQCALELIIGNSEEFNVTSSADLEELFKQLDGTLNSLIEDVGHSVSSASLNVSRLFFKHLADLMLSELSRPSAGSKKELLSVA
jgi:hypothetical protein